MTDLLTCNGGRFAFPAADAATASEYVFSGASKTSDRYTDIDDDAVAVSYQRRLDRPFPRMVDFWIAAVIMGIHDTRRQGLTPPDLTDKELHRMTAIRTDQSSTDGVRIERDVDRLLVSLYIADHPPVDTAEYTPSGAVIIDHLNRYAYAGTKPLIRAIRERSSDNAAPYMALPSLLVGLSK